MRALILNSGIGKRMGELTVDRCKCMVEIAEGVTILDEQVKRLLKCGISDMCITTGPFAEDLEAYLYSRFPDARFTFVNNPVYNETNYIYSIYLARDYLQDDIILLHGDLVFDLSVLSDVVSSECSVMVIDSTKPLPQKDFKAVVKDRKIVRVGVDEFCDAFYAQPMYKLLKEDWLVWLNEIIRFCEEGMTQVYAENALNGISDRVNLYSLDICNRICMEIDNYDDLTYAKSIYAEIRIEE